VNHKKSYFLIDLRDRYDSEEAAKEAAKLRDGHEEEWIMCLSVDCPQYSKEALNIFTKCLSNFEDIKKD